MTPFGCGRIFCPVKILLKGRVLPRIVIIFLLVNLNFLILPTFLMQLFFLKNRNITHTLKKLQTTTDHEIQKNKIAGNQPMQFYADNIPGW